MHVFVLDRHQQPLMPCHPARARQLLRTGRAVVHRHTPFTIRLKDRLLSNSTLQSLVLGIDPGSKTTGLALAREKDIPGSDNVVRHALWLAELEHRGQQVHSHLQQRAAFRRRRRSANLRYRAARFANRHRPEGWLAPSLRSRVDNVLAWTARLRRWAPVSRIALETVRFDTQLLQAPEISGVQYQQGTLAGYELRQFVLEKWRRQCAYCDATNIPLQIDHLVPKARGGSDRVSNLTLACGPCNQRKGAMPVEMFLARDSERLARLLARAQRPAPGRGRHQLHAQGAASSLTRNRAVRRGGHWRTDEVELHPPAPTKSARGGCIMCGHPE